MAVSFNGKHLAKFIRPEEYEAIYPQVELAHNQLESKTGAGNDFLGWLDLPVTYDKEEFARIKEAAQKIRSDSDVPVSYTHLTLPTKRIVESSGVEP